LKNDLKTNNAPKPEMSSEKIKSVMEKINTYKALIKELKGKLEAEVEKTELYSVILNQTLSGDYEISEKDARKHSLSVCLKNLSA
jgi:hypothetical protein